VNKVINKYILKEIAFPFFLILLILTFVLLMGKILQLMDLMVNKGIGFTYILKLIFYLAPSFLAITIPVSLLISILTGMGRLSGDSEIIVMKSSGISLYQLMPPIVAASLIAFMVTAVMEIFLVPYSNHATRNLLFTVAKQRASIGIREKVFNDDFNGLVIYAEKVPVHGNFMEDLFIADNRQNMQPITIIAKKGYIVSSPESMSVTMRLQDGSTHSVDKDLKSYKKLDFGSYDVNLDLSSPIAGGDGAKDVSEMSFSELVGNIKNPGKVPHGESVIELNKKITIPLSCILFGILAVPLGITKHRAGKSRGFVVGLFVVMLYYVIQLGGEAMGETGTISPAIGTWLATVIFGTIGIYILTKEAKEEPILPSFLDMKNNRRNKKRHI
jgi:lipopolysaccharide export system permease protein